MEQAQQTEGNRQLRHLAVASLSFDLKSETLMHSTPHQVSPNKASPTAL